MTSISAFSAAAPQSAIDLSRLVVQVPETQPSSFASLLSEPLAPADEVDDKGNVTPLSSLISAVRVPQSEADLSTLVPYEAVAQIASFASPLSEPLAPAEEADDKADITSVASLFVPSGLSQTTPQENQLFAFTELGMFGRHGAQLVFTGASADDATNTVDGVTTRASNIETLVPSALSALGQADIAPQSVEPSVSTSLEIRHRATVLLSLSDVVSSGEEAHVFAVPQGGVAVPGDADASGSFEGVGKLPVERHLPPYRGTNTLNLLISGPDNALVVVARSQCESDAERSRLRRIVEDTAAEFGINVTEFQLNGSSEPQTFQSFIGGPNGGFVR